MVLTSKKKEKEKKRTGGHTRVKSFSTAQQPGDIDAFGDPSEDTKMNGSALTLRDINLDIEGNQFLAVVGSHFFCTFFDGSCLCFGGSCLCFDWR